MTKPDWALHPRLDQDTLPILELPTSSVRLLNDRRFPWVVLVPRIPGASSWFELDTTQQQAVMVEVNVVAARLNELFDPKRINLGMIGNMVEQLHVHCVARFENDPAWPGVVWGYGSAEPYPGDQGHERCRAISSGLSAPSARD